MRSFVAVLTIVALSLIVAAALAYPTWMLVGFVADQPIHRVMHRVAMISSALGFLWLFRRCGVLNRHALGFGPPHAMFWQQMAVGLGVGVLLILPLVGALFAIGVRAPRSGLDLSLAHAIRLVGVGLATGLVVAAIEEVFFRGLLFAAVRRDSGTAAAIVLPSLLYAALHFLSGRLYQPAEQIEWSSGLAVLGGMFAKYAHPAAIADSFLALFAVGALLALVRAHTRSIAACIGLHAAWVCIIALVRNSTLVQEHPANWLVGDYDGVLGWAALVWMAMIAATYFITARDIRIRTAETIATSEQRA